MPQKLYIDLNDTGNRIIAGIVLALIFVGGWWLIARNATNDPARAGDSSEPAPYWESEGGTLSTTSVFGPISGETSTITGSNESVEAGDQRAGMSVKVQRLILAQMGWVAVRDADGRTLGAGRFEAGSHTDVVVPLLRATSAGERYQVLIYVDDGDKLFDLHKDILVTGDEGEVAGDVFSAL